MRWGSFKMPMRWAALSVTLLLAMTLQGCGGGGGSSTAAPTPSPTPPGPPGPPAPSPLPPVSTPLVLKVTQTAYLDGTTPDLLKAMPDVNFDPFEAPIRGSASLVVDATQQFQEILGFGGAFTEATADNWKKLSAKDQATVIQLYFADPKDGGHGYTVARVPMGSCDFTLASYNFDNATGDSDMKYFDTSVAHDESSGMLPMMRDAQDLVAKSSLEHGVEKKLKIFASPWSPPAWMKLPNNGKQSMLGSATPNGLDPKYQRAWANYFSKFISAYKAHKVDLWGVTVQNEPEFPAPWEACAYTPEFEAEFVASHLGPVLRKDHPDLKIMGFDHNKDHVVTWAKVLYGNAEAAKYIDGLGVHWYGGLNTQHLNTTHFLRPDKFILPTEACNCGGVVFQKDNPTEWWGRAEKIAIDILEDIKWWSVGWVDWNLVLDTSGGPNHLGNMCDANIIADPNKTIQGETIIKQASYYYMGHFSRFIPPGSRRVGLTNTVKRPPLTPKDVMDRRLRFDPCSDMDGLTWKYDQTTHTLGELGLCAELDEDGEGIVMKTCTGIQKQQWAISDVSGGKRLQNAELTEKCLTFKTVGGPTVGLDPGVDVQAGLAEKCGAVPAGQTQTFELAPSGAKTFPDGFHIKTSEGNCMLPVGADTITFDAVAFQTPVGDISIVAMNRGEDDLTFDIYETSSQMGAKQLMVPKHGIASFTITPKTKDVELFI